MGRDTQGNRLEFPACNLTGDIWFEANGTPGELRKRMEAHLGIRFDDAATETGEFSYRAEFFGFVVRLTITPNWTSGVLCRFFAGTDGNIYDFDAPAIPFGRHLARLVEVYDLGRLISHEEVKRRWREEGRG